MSLLFDPTQPMTADLMLDLQDMAANEIDIDPNVPDYMGTPTKRDFVAESIVDVLVDALDYSQRLRTGC